MIIKSKAWELIPLEQKKMVKSLFWGLVAVIALFISDYLKQYGLPEQVAFLSPLLPVLINFFYTWGRQHTYTVQK